MDGHNHIQTLDFMMSKALDFYKNILLQLDQEISKPGWEECFSELNEKLIYYHDRLGIKEKDRAHDLMEGLYHRRIGK